MSTIGKSGIETSINDNILTGGRRTTAPKVRTVLRDLNDSNFNVVDGGLVVQTESGYSTAITPSSDYSFATKKYVDDNSTSVNPRYFRTNFAATLTPDIDGYDLFIMTAVTGTVTINAPTGAAREGRPIGFRFTPTGSSQTLSWNVIFIDENVTIPTTATLGETTEIYFHYNEALTRWMCVGTNSGGGSGSGTVNSGNINELAYYAANGTAVSGLTTANNSILVTGASGTPSLSQTLPTAVQDNITRTGTLVSGSTGAGFTVALGTSTISGTLPAANGGAGASNGILKANGSGTVSAATAGTDYTTPTGTENLTNKSIGAGCSYTGNVISTTYTSAKIMGGVINTAGAIPHGTGTADTVTSTANFTYVSSGLALSSNVNGDYETRVTNTNISGQANFSLYNNNGHLARFLKYGSSKGSYKIFTASTCGFYNQGSGDIALLNDFSSGAILFSAGGSSTYHLSIGSNGYANVASRLYVGGTTSPTEALQTSGNLYFDAVGRGVIVREATNGRLVTATLVGGTVTINNTSVTNNTRILIQRISNSGGNGNFTYTISSGVSFTVTSDDVTDVSSIFCFLIEKV